MGNGRNAAIETLSSVEAPARTGVDARGVPDRGTLKLFGDIDADGDAVTAPFYSGKGPSRFAAGKPRVCESPEVKLFSGRMELRS